MTAAPRAGVAECDRPSQPVTGPQTASDGDAVAALQVLLPGQPSVQRTIADRLRTLLDERIAQECRAVVEQRLHRIPEATRLAIMPSASLRAELAAEVLNILHPSALVGLLSPAVEEERSMLLRLPGIGDPMLREASLDVLSGTPRDGVAMGHVRAGCLRLLGPGLALLGADPASPAGDGLAGDGHAQTPVSREVTLLATLQRDDREGAVRALALHAGVDEAQASDAVWTRDVRSLLGLSWRAGYSMHTALLLQTRLAGVPRPLALGPTTSGGSPMGRGELAWQLAMLAAV